MLSAVLNSSAEAYANSTPYRGPPLWYEFEACAVAPYSFIFYYGVKVLNLFVGAPCNFLVMWQIASKKSDATTSDTFFFNLAILDAYFCLMTPIELANRLFLGHPKIWHFQRFAYGVKDFAPVFLVCICLDRYMAVVHPVLFTRIRDNKIRVGISLAGWGLVLGYGITKSVMDVVSAAQVFSGLILTAFIIMLFCNLSVIWALRRSVAGKEEMHPVKKKAFKMVLIILGIIMFNYLPPVALLPFVSYFTFVEFRCQVTTSVFSLMDMSSTIEPLLYISKMDMKCNGGCCCCRRAAV
ncbi:unnamed protein product [Merluccius merluccius]